MGWRPATRTALDAYWAARLGCDPGALSADGVTVSPVDVGRRGDVQVMARDETVVVTAPSAIASDLRDRVADPDAIATMAPTRLADILGIEAAATLGPQFIGYADADTAVPVHGPDAVKPLRPHDARALAALRMATPPDEWYDRVGGFAIGAHEGLFGRFDGDELVAVSAYGADDAVAGIAVLTHPNHRGAGHGTVAVSAAVEAALADDLIPEYRLHEDWRVSRRLAEGLGFERYATRFVLVPVRYAPSEDG